MFKMVVSNVSRGKELGSTADISKLSLRALVQRPASYYRDNPDPSKGGLSQHGLFSMAGTSIFKPS